MQLMSTKISENTNVTLDLKTVIAIIVVTASFVGMYYTLQADIEEARKLPPIDRDWETLVFSEIFVLISCIK